MESSEHRLIGNRAVVPDTLSLGSDKFGTLLLTMESRSQPPVSLTYGDLVALGGDMYGTPDAEPIASGQSEPERIARFHAAHTTLVDAPRTELTQIMAIMDAESSEVLLESHRDPVAGPAEAFRRMGDAHSFAWNEATGGGSASDGAIALWNAPGRYTLLATNNMDHFGADARLAYRAGHIAACTMARVDLQAALVMNAHADHFLTDLFAGGHIRTPRRALNDHPWATLGLLPSTTVGALLSKAMHDEENATGLVVTSVARMGQTWRAYGDREVLEPAASHNLAAATAAVQASVDEVIAARDAESGDQPGMAALDHAPYVEGPHPPIAGPSIMPMFFLNEGRVHERGGRFDIGPGPQDAYTATGNWTWPVAIGTTLLPSQMAQFDVGAIRDALERGILDALVK